MTEKDKPDIDELCELFLSDNGIITGLESLEPPTSDAKPPATRHSINPINVWRDFVDNDEDDGLIFGSNGFPRKHSDNPCRNHRSKQAILEDAERLIQRMKSAEETNLIDLYGDETEIICLDDDADRIGSSTSIGACADKDKQSSSSSEDGNLNLLPRSAIIYDYTTQPVTAHEQKRHFLPHFGTSSAPFLRPIVIDGVGLVKAYRNCCCTNTTYFPFPIVPIIRCMFYWISKGHSTVLCFPSMFNPIDHEIFNATPAQKNALQQLRRFKMCTIFETTSEDDNRNWYYNVLNHHRACLITTVSQWRLSMPNNLVSGVVTLSESLNYSVNSGSGRYNPYDENRIQRLLQPFFSHEGKLVFFSSFSSQGTSVAEMILDNAIVSHAEFEHINSNQLSFVEQARMLKVLHSFVPKTSRFRETAVMVKILERLKPFLP